MHSNCKGTIHTRTWEKDSYGLFDYEKTQVKSASFGNYSTGAFYRNDNTHGVVYFKEKGDLPSEHLLANLAAEEDKLMLWVNLEKNLPINNTTLTDLQKKIWNVVRSSSNLFNSSSDNSHKYELKLNDIIKLGRIKFLVKDMNVVAQESQSSAEVFLPYFDNDTNQETNGSVCRICYVAESSDDNPVISVCKCKGTMHLHVYCLKKWLESKLTTTENTSKPVVSYTVKSFNCEICKEPYPITIKHKDSNMHLINYNVPENQNYLILQSLNSIKENEYPLSIHVMMFIEDESSFNLGRGHESDIRISDISVSRLHAKISISNGKIYIEDKSSKFGTLVLAKEPVNLLTKNSFQIGRTLLYYNEEKEEDAFFDSDIADEGIDYDVNMNDGNN